MIDKLISSSTIIAKVIADNDLREKDIRIADIRAWIGEAIEKIGAITQLDHRVAVIPIKGYLALLPCDVYRLDQVAYSRCGEKGWLPMRRTSASFFKAPNSKCCKGSKCCGEVCDTCEKSCETKMYIHDEPMLQLVKVLYNLNTDAEAADKLNSNPDIRPTLATLIDLHTTDNPYGFKTCNQYLQYDVKPGYIVCPVRDGFLKVSYYQVHTDNEGMPMIPDMLSYQEAIYWYITMKMFYPKYVQGKIHQNVYYGMLNSWNFYAKQAYSEAMMPTVDGLEAIQNNWNRLYPELNDHDEFFLNLGDEQIIYNW